MVQVKYWAELKQLPFIEAKHKHLLDKHELGQLELAMSQLEKKMSQFTSVDEMFEELKYIISKQASEENSTFQRLNTRLLKLVNRELKEVTGRLRDVELIKFDLTLLTVHLSLTDARYGSKVDLYLTVPDQYPATKPECKWDLDTVDKLVDTSSISAAVTFYLKEFKQKYSRILGWLKRIDERLKSKQVDGNVLARRMNLQNSSCSVIIDFSSVCHDPTFSMSIKNGECVFPRVQVLGPESECSKFLSQIERNKYKWDGETVDMIAILEDIIGAKFSLIDSKEHNLNDMIDQDSNVETDQCAICYADAKEMPLSTQCNVCMKQYHNSCLREWFQSLPSCRLAFDRIFGQCPYCQAPLSLKLGKK